MFSHVKYSVIYSQMLNIPMRHLKYLKTTFFSVLFFFSSQNCIPGSVQEVSNSIYGASQKFLWGGRLALGQF